MARKMKILLIVNPTSGQHRSEQAQPELLTPELMRSESVVVQTDRVGDAERIASEATEAGGWDGIVIAGGDGTVNEVINGILKVGQKCVAPPIGIIPMGTSNILATELGIPLHSPSEAVAIIERAKQRKIDVGTANGRCFSLMASFGWDAEAVKRVEPIVKDLVGAPAYILSGLAALAEYRASAVDITIDGTRMRSEAFVVLVANTSSYAMEQVKIAPFASPDDGWLDICVFEKPPNDKIGFIGQLLLIMARRHLGDPRVRYYRGKSITIVATPPMLGQIDGDLWSETPTTIDILPHAVTFFVP
jgi:diacylglycerol kinase (ATP)